MRIEQADGDDEPSDAADAPPRADEPAEPSSESERRGELPDAQTRAARVAEDRARVDAAYRTHAIDRGYERVREIERETVTPAMKRIEAEDPDRHLVGLENRLKGKERLSEKVMEAMTERARTPDQAFASVKDAIRYTFCYSEDRYTEEVYADCERLEDSGFELIERPNSWKHEEYKGINSRWRVPENGQLFEVQFHTLASYEAKQETHWAYEKLRNPATPKAEQEKLSAYQREVTARVPVPPGAQDIPDYP